MSCSLDGCATCCSVVDGEFDEAAALETIPSSMEMSTSNDKIFLFIFSSWFQTIPLILSEESLDGFGFS